jgi:hypothetical protein
MMGTILITFLLVGCGIPEVVPTSMSPPTTYAEIPVRATPVPPTSTPPTSAPTAALHASLQEGLLMIISPLETTQLSGGENLRIAFNLVGQDDLPVEGVSVQGELWTPSGEIFASVPCIDIGKGRYVSEYVGLPLRGAGGTWHIIGKATLKDDQIAEVESTFQAKPSISEAYQKRYGFWIEHPKIFGLGTGFYNLSDAGGLHFEDWVNEDGSGYVILDNYRYTTIGVTFAALEIHWRHVEFPVDEATAIDYAQSLVNTGLHHQDPDTPITNLTAKMVSFQSRSAWQVLGRGNEYYVSKAASDYPVEWLILQCPGSDWLWSLVISTDDEVYVNHLRAVRETFECPPINPDL